MKIFKVLFMFVSLFISTSFVSLPVLADNPHNQCTAAVGCIPPLVVPFTQLGGAGGTFNFGGPGQTLAINPGVFSINTDSQLDGNQITKLSVSCLAYNSYQSSHATVYNPEDNGLNGGTITFLEINKDSSVSTVVTLGTVVLPSAPHGGPYINTASTILGSPVFPNAGSTLTAYLSAYNTVSDQYWTNCNASVSQ